MADNLKGEVTSERGLDPWLNTPALLFILVLLFIGSSACGASGPDWNPNEAEAVVIINTIAADEFSQEDLAQWLEKSSTPLAEGEL